MRGEVFFEKMTGISEEYITEAALVPAVGASPAKRPENRFAALSRILNSGWGVACICFIVAIASVVGMVAWGRMGDPTGPAGNGQFGFSYEILDEDGQPLTGLVRPGYTVIVDTSIINQGDSFTYFGSESDYNAHAQFVMHTDERKIIQGISTSTHDKGTHKVETGMSSNTRFIFTIPENAAAGIYDLVLSYKGSQQVYPGVLMVEEAIDKPFPELTDDHPLSFGYEPFLSSTVSTGTELILEAWVVNDGEGFKVNGEFRPQATLCYADEAVPYTIQGELIKEGISSTITYVESGATGRGAYTFDIPEDAPTGSYSLVLSFGGASQSFAGVVTVDDPSAFSFGYEPFGGFAIPSDRLTMETWVRNDGEPFTYEGSSMGFAPAAVLIHMETQYRIDGSFGVDDDHGVFTVNPGDVGRVTQEFFIPDDAPTGDYALQLSYGGNSMTFENVLTVAEPTSPDLGNHEDSHFSFDYELLNSPDPAYAAWKAGDTIRIKVSVTNQGAPFTYTGSSGDFIPYPELYLKTVENTRLTLHGTTSLPEDRGTFTVSTGQTGTAVYEFLLSDDIPAGYLEFAMSYADKGTGKYSFGYISNASYTKEEALAFAAEQLSESHPELDLSQYVPRCVDSLGAGFDYKVQFQYQYYGYTVIEGKTVTVSLTADKKLSGIEIKDEYAAYTETLTENVFLSAIQNIRNGILEINQAADPTEIMESLLSFQIDDEGYLCLTMEYIGPPRYDENGNNLSGCIDHEHYFFTERLCSKP